MDRLGLTCYGAQQSQGGRVARVLIDHPLAVSLGGGHAEGDGLVEFTAPRLDRNNR